MLAKFNIFFSALGFVFSFLIYTNAFLNPEISCVLGAQNCIELVFKPVFRNFALFLALGFFLSFITNFAKFFVSKEGYKIAVVTNLVFNLLTFLVAGVLMIMSITTMESKGNINILGILVWGWSFVNIVISLLEMKPQVSLSHTEEQGGHSFAFSVLMFLLLGSIGSVIFSNAFIQRKNMLLLDELSKGNIAKEQVRAATDLSPLLLSLDRLREDLKSNNSGNVSIDYSKMESSMKSAIVSAFSDIMSKGGKQRGEEQRDEEEELKNFAISEFDIENDHFLGGKNAPVTIVEFGSFTCPHCIRLHSVIKGVLDKYGDKVKYVYKHFTIHGEIDVKLSELVEAAGAQGKYAEFFNKLMDMETIKNVIADYEKGELNKQKILDIVKELGLDVGEFEEAIDKRIFKDKVNKHLDVAIKLGIRGTPSVFIGGKEYRGARTVDAFSQIIDEELKKAGK